MSDLDAALDQLFHPETDPIEFAKQYGFPVVRIVHKWGHGQWHILEAETRLVGICNYLNARYPHGNHHVEYMEQ